jgi:multimeric flavodoxin WrbA
LRNELLDGGIINHGGKTMTMNVTKKVLVLSASPRKGGNSDLLCDQFVLGAKEAGNQVEKIFLRDKRINYCIGCGTCKGNGGNCVQKPSLPSVGKW